LERLEKAAATVHETREAQKRRDEEDDSEMEAKWAIMCTTMSEVHARIVVDAYAAGLQDVQHPDWGSPASTLLQRCLDALRCRPYWPYTQIRPEVALAMPPHVADVYLADRDALPLHSCEECGYRVPHQYFRECPLCGGRVGWNAYWHKHKDDPRTGE
jgi:hypothetical protein